MPRTDEMPSRTATPPVLTAGSHGSRVASAAEASMHGVRTSTPWRRASCTRVCGE